jgi:hypothetical protein
MDSPRYRINAPTAVSEIIDGEAVIMNLESGHYFSARGLAGALWEGTIAGGTAGELATAVAATWPQPTVDSDVRTFLAQLLEHKLVVPANLTAADLGVLAPMLKALAVQRYQAPVLDVFTDMEDLLLLDPIHDVGEAGWPMPMSGTPAEGN